MYFIVLHTPLVRLATALRMPTLKIPRALNCVPIPRASVDSGLAHVSKQRSLHSWPQTRLNFHKPRSACKMKCAFCHGLLTLGHRPMSPWLTRGSKAVHIDTCSQAKDSDLPETLRQATAAQSTCRRPCYCSRVAAVEATPPGVSDCMGTSLQMIQGHAGVYRVPVQSLMAVTVP